MAHFCHFLVQILEYRKIRYCQNCMRLHPLCIDLVVMRLVSGQSIPFPDPVPAGIWQAGSTCRSARNSLPNRDLANIRGVFVAL